MTVLDFINECRVGDKYLDLKYKGYEYGGKIIESADQMEHKTGFSILFMDGTSLLLEFITFFSHTMDQVSSIEEAYKTIQTYLNDPITVANSFMLMMPPKVLAARSFLCKELNSGKYLPDDGEKKRIRIRSQNSINITYIDDLSLGNDERLDKLKTYIRQNKVLKVKNEEGNEIYLPSNSVVSFFQEKN